MHSAENLQMGSHVLETPSAPLPFPSSECVSMTKKKKKYKVFDIIITLVLKASVGTKLQNAIELIHVVLLRLWLVMILTFFTLFDK